MSVPERNAPVEEADLPRRWLWRRVGGRLVVAGVVVALSAAYALALKFSRLTLRAQAGAQFALDALLVTWLVRATGDLGSPSSALSIVAISVASVFLGARGSLLMSVWCAACYTATMVWVATVGRGLAPSSMAESVETTGVNDVAFLVVGLLAARLAVRQTRSEVEMREAASALASLRALHERIVESIRSGVITTDLSRRVYTANR